VFPINVDDWHFFIPSVIEKIKEYAQNGWKIVIFTNQSGLLSQKKGNLTLEEFKIKWININTQLKTQYNLHSVYAIISLYDDFYRKPCIEMWRFVEKHLNDSIKLNSDMCLYVGDMAGRKGDHSYSDLMFAMNLNIAFMVPEVFSNSDIMEQPSDSNSWSMGNLIKTLENDTKIFNPIKFMKQSDLKNISKRNKQNIVAIEKLLTASINNDSKTHEKYIFLYVGSPASGKSSFIRNYLPELKDIILLSMDTFNGTMAKFIKEVEKNMKMKKTIIIDNTNGTVKIREKYIHLAKLQEYKTAIIYFDTPKDVVLHLNAIRTKMNNVCSQQKDNTDDREDNIECRTNVPAVAIHTYWKKLELPDKTREQFDELFTIHFEPLFQNTKVYDNHFTLYL
jgi:bifunctional polynucleotide phosphatase/kinase